MTEIFLTRAPYLLFVVLLMVGTYILLVHRSLLKALVGLYLFQTGIILFFIMVAYRIDATVPIVPHHGSHGDHAEIPEMINPLPHAMMLTAIVVGVATLGVALSILTRVHEEAGTIQDIEEE